MGILLCEQNFRDVWIRNKSVRAEIGQILRTHTQTHTHTTAAKLVVRIGETNTGGDYGCHTGWLSQCQYIITRKAEPFGDLLVACA